MAINRASIAKQLLPGLNAVFGVEYGEVNDEHTPLFDTENSDRSFEEEVLFTGFGTAPVKSEGAAVSFDEFAISWFVSGLNKTVPVIILEIVQGNIDPQVNAIGTFVFFTSITLVITAQIFFLTWQMKGKK